MQENELEDIYRAYRRRLALTPTHWHRYLYDRINWDSHLIGIKGQRGVGKTTLMLQHIKEHFADSDQALYVSLDHLWFATHSLAELVDYHYAHGGTHLFLDEVHFLPSWQTVLKNLTDNYPDLHIAYTGSSMLEIDSRQGDLSRRQIVYTLHEMSLREYLLFEGLISDLPAIPLETLLSDHVRIASRLTSQMKVLPLFEQYLRTGCYPFYKRDHEGFGYRLQEVARQAIETDLPHVEDVTFATLQKAKRMLMIYAERVPQTPKMAEVYQELETNREQGLKLLHALQRAGLLMLVSSETKNLRSLSRPNKILLGNPNLMYALSPRIDIGALRETFFCQQVSATCEVHFPPQGDFLVDRRYLFEVGGRSKTFSQIKDVPDSYLAVDATEVGHHNRIPLWMFGLLY